MEKVEKVEKFNKVQHETFDVYNAPNPDGAIAFRSKASVKIDIEKEVVTMLEVTYIFNEIIQIAKVLKDSRV